MFIDVDSLYLLQVLPPKVKIEILSSKSAKNSLYHLLNRTCTPYGGSLLKSWLIKPLYDLSAIKNRQDLIENLLNNSSLMHTIRLNLRKICHLPSCLFSIKVGKVIWSKWNSLIDFLYCVINILNEIHQVEFMVEPDLIKKLLGIDLALLTNIHLYLLHFIDISRSNLEKNLYLQSGIDPLLDDLRNNYENLDTILENANIHIDSTLVLNNRIVTVYIPQIGFLVCYDCSNFDDVPISDQNQISTWSFLFSSDTDSYFKNSTTTTLDETYGDIYQLISDREIELISTLKDVISENDNTLIATFDLITELDCICALAVVSQNSNYIKPELVNDAHTFDVVKGRHPLVETSVEFAPNDLKLNLDENLGSILVVTGANMSGKSVYLNQAALIVIMAQIGCFVPCESARIGLVDKILTRIMSRETVDKNQSTFAIDIHQLSKCLLLATSSSLLIIDEFGKGCDSFDGPALFGSTLKYLIDFEHYPRTLVSTHFHEVFANNLKILGGREVEQKLRFCYMDVKLNAKSSLLINYLHQIRDGIGFESFGNYCAKVCGVPDGIVKRAEEISTLQSKGLNFLNHSLSENEQGNYEVVEECLTCFLNVDLDVNLNDAASVGKCLESFRKCIEI